MHEKRGGLVPRHETRQMTTETIVSQFILHYRQIMLSSWGEPRQTGTFMEGVHLDECVGGCQDTIMEAEAALTN